MPDQIFIGNFSKGLKTDRLPFVIDNDAFPTMYNFYSWRGRAKRKRGTKPLGQLTIQVLSVSVPTKPWQDGPLTLNGNGKGNLFTTFSLPITSSIQPGSITFKVGSNIYTDPLKNGVLVGTPFGSGTINYATGAISITAGGGAPLTGTFSYYPGLPVMALADFAVMSSTATDQANLYPFLLAFDTMYSYQINGAQFYNTTYYSTGTPFVWSGGDYQQFWTTNYSNVLWATNNKPGLHLLKGTATGGGPSTTQTFTFTLNGNPYTSLLVGDVLWFNEWPAGDMINGLTATITTVSGGGVYIVTFQNPQTITPGDTGIVQVLTNSILDSGGKVQDGIRYYTGDPTAHMGIPTGTANLGWVNFAPPLTASTVSIDNYTSRPYYLVGALAILPFKDRLLFFSPWIESSAGTGTLIQLQDTVLWSWNGTPFYAGNPNPSILNIIPINETSNIMAYYVDQTGFGGYLPAGLPQPIATVSNNEDVLIIGFGGDGRKTRFVYTGNDLQPFLFFNINSELPSQSTFSAIALDRGVIDIGQYGIAMTDQQSSQRIDLDIPDSVFEIQALNFGAQRVNAIRDFFREWIYFSYPAYGSQWKFPTNTFLFNYRDNTWAILYENYTAHGTFRPQSKKSWSTTGYKSWNAWREPWVSGTGSPQFPNIIAGNPQGWVLITSEGTSEAPSGTISAITSNVLYPGLTQITSYNHCVSEKNVYLEQAGGDYLQINGALGVFQVTITGVTLGTTTILTAANTAQINQQITITGIVGTTQLNGNTYIITAVTPTTITISVDSSSFVAYVSGGIGSLGLIGRVVATLDENNFIIDLPFPSGTYMGLGTFTRLSQPLLQTKQFPVYWDQGRQTRLGVQRYLFDTTVNSQVTVNIYLSQDPDDAWNNPLYNPSPNSLIYSQIVYTCPESTNLGLTPANVSLQNQIDPIGNQFQTWHRMNTSLQGDTFQIGITLSDAQMRNIVYATSEIALQGIHLTVERGPVLA